MRDYIIMHSFMNLQKEIGIEIKSKQTSNQLGPVTRNTYAPSCIGYCYDSKPNACTNKAFSKDLTPSYFG